ncbi:MAG: hypothetical protein P4M15_04020 [Alphaproteobacteria bacterium]|nr:hypothetical protein [Alphaproteobacteria bacterium]
MGKNLLIGACSDYDWPTLAPWVKSANACGFQGDKIMIAFRASYDTVLKLFDHGFQVVMFNRDEEKKVVWYESPNRVYIERFLQIYNFLRDKASSYDYVIAADTRDVIFQTDPAAWLRDNLGDKKLVVAGEGIRYRDEQWNRDNLVETYGPQIYDLYKDNEIYNVGTIGGRGEAMRDLVLDLFTGGVNRVAPIVDQAVLNVLIQSGPYKDKVKFTGAGDAFACQAAVGADPKNVHLRPFLTGPAPVFEDGVVKNAAGKVFSMVHQYDRVPAWKESILQKYAA